jgi:hypothetical protein
MRMVLCAGLAQQPGRVDQEQRRAVDEPLHGHPADIPGGSPPCPRSVPVVFAVHSTISSFTGYVSLTSCLALSR